MYSPTVMWPQTTEKRALMCLTRQREMDRQALVAEAAPLGTLLSVGCVRLCTSQQAPCVARLWPHAVDQHVFWTGLLNILMVPLTEGSRPEQVGSGAHWPPVLYHCFSGILNTCLLNTPVTSH